MRATTTFLAVVSLAALLIVMVRSHQPAPRLVIGYVAWVAISTVIANYAISRVALDDYGYFAFYALSLLGAAVLMCLQTVSFTAVFPVHDRVILCAAAGALSFVVALLVSDAMKQGRNWWYASAIILLQGMVFLPCGIVTLVSLAQPSGEAGMALRITLGSYWLLIGGWSLAHVAGVEQNRAIWYAIGDWFPATCGVFAFGGLAVWLSTLQNESARELLPALQVAERMGGR